MKAKELMIGDWVLNTKTNEPISIGEVSPGFVDAGLNGVVNSEDIAPIPLTPEILEKNGFERDDPQDIVSYCYRQDADGIIIAALYISCDGYRGIFAYAGNRLRKTLYFVHELQHALRLCGIKKEVII